MTGSERLARAVVLPDGFLARMPARLRPAALGGGPLPEADAARADELDRQADAAAIEEMRTRQRAFRRNAWEDSLSRAVGYRDASLGRLRPQQDPGGLVSGWLGQQSRTLLLPGESRRGKTYAAYAVGNEAHLCGTWVTAWRVSDLLRHLRPSDLDPGRAARAWDAATAAEIAILDDLGGENRTPWTAEQVMDVMDARTRNGLRTVVTTNMSHTALIDAYGEPLVYRLLELATVAKIAGSVLTPAPKF